MSRLPSLSSGEIVRILKNLGFELDHSTGSHFIFYHSQTKKRAVVPSRVKDLPKGTLMSILKEAGISRKEFEDYSK